MDTASSSSSSLNPHLHADNEDPTTAPEKPTNPEKPNSCIKKKANKKAFKDAASVSSASTRGTRVRRSPKVVVTSRRKPNSDEIGFRFGMSIAAFFVQILESNGELGGGMSSDRLAKMCGSAVRESLVNDYGNEFDCFIQNFEKSFGSTLRTLKSIKKSSENNMGYLSSNQNPEGCSPCVTHDTQDGCLRREGCRSSSSREDCHSEELTHTNATEGILNYRDMLSRFEVEVAPLNGLTNQLTIPPRTVESLTNQPILSTFEKSVVEQTRANNLKTFELGLAMKRLELKEEQLHLGYNSNHLERTKIAMGVSKASFKNEKFKTQLEDTRHAELLRKCIDCLVAGLFVMAASLSYGAYVYSYKKITEAAASCTRSEKGSSWWNPVASVNSGFQVVRCQAEVLSRMLFGLFMILAIAYLLLQRSAGSKQTMPVTFILLLLGIACGWAGKFCVDTLGGSGYHWIMYWETLCLFHFFCNVCTSLLFCILHGPIDVTPGTKRNSIFPYWMRRMVFYSILILFLPLCCGLLPFASFGDWKHHFLTDVDYWGMGASF